jgi:PIN domain nuclease of toxin-antitoxin system
VAEQVSANKLQLLPISLSHALKTYSLPDHHRDPFDRLLVAQSTIGRSRF